MLRHQLRSRERSWRAGLLQALSVTTASVVVLGLLSLRQFSQYVELLVCGITVLCLLHVVRGASNDGRERRLTYAAAGLATLFLSIALPLLGGASADHIFATWFAFTVIGAVGVGPVWLLIIGFRHSHPAPILAGITAGLLLPLVAYTSLVQRWPEYAYHYVACGHQPVIGTDLGAAFAYSLPGDRGYGPGLFNNLYACSESDALRRGYHRTPS